jgi:hypothetical protein
MRAPAVRRRHSQGLTDDGGRPTRHFRGARGRRFGLQAPAPRAVTPKSGCSRCRVVRRAPSLALRDDGHRSKERRHLPWGSVPLDEISPEDRWRADLPHRRLPLPGFLTLSAA